MADKKKSKKAKPVDEFLDEVLAEKTGPVAETLIEVVELEVVTVRAQQSFDEFRRGDVINLPRTERVSALIKSGAFLVLEAEL